MSFVPASSIAPATVTVSGTVSADVTDRVGRLLGHADVDNFPASQAVTGPLTDAQLRAAAVPVDASGATVPVSGPLTSAQLAALEPLTVSGPLTDAQLGARLPLSVAGPLTDAQLRASAVPVSGSGVFHIDDNGGSLTVD